MPDQIDMTGMDHWQSTEKIMPMSGRELTLRKYLVQSEELLEKMREVCVAAPDVTHDTETSGLNVHLGARVIGHAFATQTGPAELSAWYVPIRHINTAEVQLPVEQVSEVVNEILQGEGRAGYHHAKFDWIQSRVDDIDVLREAHDVSILATIDNENEPSFALKRLSAKYCIDSARDEESALDDWMRADARKLKLKYKKRARGSIEEVDLLEEPTYLERFGYSRTPIHLCGKYACKDVIYTLYLWLIKYRDVPQLFPQVYNREQRISYILHEMEWVGLPVDESLIREVHERTGKQIISYLKECRRLTGNADFTGTDDQVREFFYGEHKLEPPKWTKGGKYGKKKPSVDKEAREILKRRVPHHEPALTAIGNLAEVAKIHGTYAGNFLRYYAKETGRIYPHYNQLEEREEGGVPVTGRLSSQDPNIQNIASRPLKLADGSTVNIREYFTVPDGWIRFYIDFEQIELKVLAWFSQDPNLLRAYREGLDVHQMTADLLGIDRKVAKQVNFGNSYGMTKMGLAQRMPGYYSDPEGTREEAERVLHAFFETYGHIKLFRARLASDMRRNNCMFMNPFGRPRRIPIINSDNRWERERGERQMMSSIISGTAADLMKECMIRTYDIIRDRDSKGQLVQTIHDELVFDFPLDEPWAYILIDIVREMEDWPMFSEAGPKGLGEGVPIRVSVDITTTTWAEKKGIAITPDGQFQWKV